MATQDYAASIQGVAIRVTRLDASGTPLNGPGDSYTTQAFMRVSFTPEYEEGDEITEKSASGQVCVSYKSPDTLKRITMELAICEPDPELTALVAGGLLLRKNIGSATAVDRKSIGWSSPAVGDDPAGNGVAIETWSLAVQGGKRASVLPYFHWVFPYAKLRQSGDRVIENGLLANTFEGYGLGNSEFNMGPDERWEFPVATERPYSYARAGWAPSGLSGFYTWHGDLTRAIDTREIATNGTVTLTTANSASGDPVPHGFEPGDQVTIGGTTPGALAGTYTVATTPSPTTFTFASTLPSTAAGSVSGVTATVSAGARDVKELADGTDTDAFNVPGSAGYNADVDLDNIVYSQLDPTT